MRWLSIGVIVLTGLNGCAQRAEIIADPLNTAPTDFGLALSVLTGPDAPQSEQVHLRQSRYVLFADGSLHHGEDPNQEQRPGWLPPLSRVLTRRQVAEVWSLASRLGLTNPSAASGSLNVWLVKPPPEGVAHVVVFTGWGERWSFERSGEFDEADAAIVQFTRHLARLAWASDRPVQPPSVTPIRYDFGADPYSRFRQPGGAPAADVQPQAKVGGAQ